ncbi:NfeD family protein [uncultured Thiothrix sp.]|uniref:NfeD family protein n=1 Tax=uncultured Thiothrix sp. TaxID=223185 RepID=UPI002618F4FF|nr:NfeD family protein [uncultured Thiothrix sp.]
MDTQEQQTASVNRDNATTKDGNKASQLLTSTLDRIRSGELKARLHYFLFQQTQQAKESDSLLSKYKRRLLDDWQLWLGLGMFLTALMMFASPQKTWIWQLPLVLFSVVLAPIVFEIPAALNSLFGHTEHQHLVGKIVTLTRPIVDRRGQTILEGREWLVSGPDCPTGAEVKIVTLDAKTLYVIPKAGLRRANA